MTTETNFKCVVYYIISLLYKISLTFSLRGFFRFSNNFLHISLMCLTFFFIIITLKSLEPITNTLLKTWT